MIKFSTTVNTWLVCLLFLGSSTLVFSKDHASGEKNTLKILSYNIKHGRDIDLALIVFLLNASFHDQLFVNNQLVSNLIDLIFGLSF